jgi:GGDEF domain-containing protein
MSNHDRTASCPTAPAGGRRERADQSGDLACQVGASIGIATYDATGTTMDTLMSRADAAM